MHQRRPTCSSNPPIYEASQIKLKKETKGWQSDKKPTCKSVLSHAQSFDLQRSLKVMESNIE